MRLFVLTLLFASICTSAFAQADGKYYKAPGSGCQVWWHVRGEDYSVQSLKWNGTCPNGMAQGRGTFQVLVKYEYENEAPTITAWTGEGDFSAGKLGGRGFMVSKDLRLEGEFRDGVLNGRGIQTYVTPENKTRSEGEYRDGKRNAYGISRSTELVKGKTVGSVWEAQYQDDHLEGASRWSETIRGCAEQKYEGEFSKYQFHGRGSLKAFARKVYSGFWQESALGGRHIMSLSSIYKALERRA